VLDRAADGEAPKLALIRAHADGGRLVEIGAAFGIFARAAQRAGFEVTALEMDARCCRYLEEVVGVDAIETDAPRRFSTTSARRASSHSGTSLSIYRVLGMCSPPARAVWSPEAYLRSPCPTRRRCSSESSAPAGLTSTLRVISF